MVEAKVLLAHGIAGIAPITRTGLMAPRRCDGQSHAIRVNDDILLDQLLEYQLIDDTVSAWTGRSDTAAGGGETL
jgi:hypothetical protein